MTTFQTQLLSEIKAGHDGPRIPEAKLVYFRERFRSRLFDFVLGKFWDSQNSGLTQAKLSRRIGKSPEVINRWLTAPSNLTADSISDLLIGIGGEEMDLAASSVLNRRRTNYSHLDEFEPEIIQPKGTQGILTIQPTPATTLATG